MDPFTLIISSCSLIMTTMQYKHQIGQVNHYEIFARHIADMKNEKLDEYDNFIIKLLEDGSTIVTHLRSKVQRRLIEVIFLILVLMFGASLDLSNIIGTSMEILSNYVIGAISIVASSLSGILIFSKEEKLFIKNMNVLNDVYHKNVVEEAIKIFNAKCDEDESFTQAKIEYVSRMNAMKRGLRVEVNSINN